MCEPIKKKNISVEFERDAGLRAMEVVIINHDREGEEKQALRMYCCDDGRIRTLDGREIGQNLTDGVRVV